MPSIQGTSGTPRARLTVGSGPTITGTTTVGQTLTCNPGVWTGRRLTLTYQWIRNASTTIDGATSATYLLVEADGTNTVKCRVTATPADTNYAAASATSASTATIAAE